MAVEKEIDIKKSGDLHIIKRLLPYAKKELGILVACFIFICITTGIDLLIPYLTKIAVDDAIANLDTKLLGKIAILFVSLIGSNFLFSFLNVYLLNSRKPTNNLQTKK
jgi:ATP-binding cassette, subfamily B, multidrug efflux pump